jgi:hypothetical protein
MEHALHKALALADAELSASEVPALVSELARNPSLVRALQVYVAVGRRRIAGPYAAKRDEPVPQWLIDTVMQAPIGETSRRAYGSYAGALIRRLKDRYSMPGWSLAAGPAFAAVLAAVSVWLLLPASSHGNTLLTAQLQRAIETTDSGDNATLLTFRPVLTFTNKQQAYCRQFEIRSGTERSAAVACREPDGSWQVVKETPPAGLGTAPAGSAREELDRYVASEMSGSPIEKEEVGKLTRNRWQQSN